MHGHIDLEIKIAIVGDPGTGKSALFHCYLHNEFPHKSIQKVYKNSCTYARLRDKVIKLDIW